MARRSAALLSLFALAAACATPSGAEADHKPTAGAHRTAITLTGVEGTAGTRTKLAADSCPLLSADGQRAACLVHELDMGDLTSAFTVHDLERSGLEIDRQVIFQGNTGDAAAGVKKDALGRANQWLADGRYTLEGKTQLTKLSNVIHDGDMVRVTVSRRQASLKRPEPPAGWDAQGKRCCRFEPSSVTHFERVGWLAVTFDVACRLHGDPKTADPCYLEGYNDESRPLDTATRFVRLPRGR